MQQVDLDFGRLKSEKEAKIDHLVFLEDLQGFSKSSNLLATVVIRKTYNGSVAKFTNIRPIRLINIYLTRHLSE